MDNKADIADWNEDAELEKLGIAYAKATAEFLKLEARKTEENVLYRVQVGAYREKVNAEKMQESLKNAGFDAVIVSA